ncbi:YihY/virulence factor BrkB family protein [Candidatus Fermentibacterales bacterium]|nr:YihY/virulence factor BrkB family protein [Candidatus Fermentibacterales bacterium]
MNFRRRLLILRQFAGHLLRRMYNKWNDDSVYFSAAAIAFNVLVTIVPLGLLLVSLASFGFKGSEELRITITEWMDDSGALVSEDTRADIESALSAGSKVTGVIGLLTLLWLVSRLFGTIRTSFDRVFEVVSGRHVVLGKLYDFFLALLVSLCFFAAFLLTTASTVVTDSTLGQALVQLPLVGSLLGTGSARLLGLTFVFLMLFTLYKAAPNRKVSKRQALLATVVAIVFLDLGTILYTWSISQPDWGIVYGSLAAVIATFFWLYWSCVILIGAAELSQVVHEWVASRRAMKHLEKVSEWKDSVAV